MADPNVSNGTCYFTENSETKGDFIPCGNVALSHWPCCHAGDMCLGFQNANACWDEDTGNTYIAGCTDVGFNDRACPWKSTTFHEQEWVAIQHCSGSGKDIAWGGCVVDVNSTELERLPHDSCDPYCSLTLWSGPSAIPAFASLPASQGGSILWMSDFNPTSISNPPTLTKPTSTPTTTSASQPTITSAPTATSTATPPSTGSPQESADTGLSTGAKAGIGIGAAAAALLILAVVLLMVLVRRRRKKSETSDQYQLPPDQIQRQQQHFTPQPSPLKPWHPGPVPDDTGTAHASGFKSELAADEPQRQYYQPRQAVKSELPVDNNYHNHNSNNLDPHASPYPSTLSQSSLYQTYDGTSTVSDGSTLRSSGQSRYVSPQSTGDGQSRTAQPSPRQGGAMGPISELQGSEWRG